MNIDWSKFISRGGIVLTGGMLAAGLAAAPAFAGGAPTACPQQAVTAQPNSGSSDANPGGSCAVTGTITITTAISLSTNITSFALNGASLNTPSGAGQVEIASNVPTGYYISEAGPSGGFSNGTNTLPDSAVSAAIIGGSAMHGTTCPTSESFVPLPDPAGTPTSMYVLQVTNQPSGSLNCAKGFTGYTPKTGDDSFDLNGWELTSVNGTPAGVYTGTVQLALWGT